MTLREQVEALAKEWEREAASRIAGAKFQERIGARRLAADLRLGAEFELAHAERLRAALAEHGREDGEDDVKDEFKRQIESGTEMRGRHWTDRYEGPKTDEKRALRRKARRKMKAAPAPAGEEG